MQPPTTVYLDHAATTPLRAEARAAMLPYLEDRFANASSLYAAAREARKGVEEARERVAAAVGARPEEVVFTSGGTEADNLALKGVARRGRAEGRTRVVVSAIEHHAVLDTARWLEKDGSECVVVPVTRDGIVDVEALARAVDRRTAVVSVMLANNETGVLQPVEQAAAIARDAGVRFHTDAVQALRWVPVDAAAADLISLSAHKIGGPKGTGALVVRRGVGIEPLLHGGGQERGLRSGTYDVAGIAGFGVAAELAVAERETAGARVRALRDRLEHALVAAVPGVEPTTRAERLPNISHVCIPGVSSETLLLLLDGAGLAASSGSACQSGATEPSHVLRAMGVPAALAAGALRLSLGPATTEADVDAAVVIVEEAVRRLRR